MQDAGVVAAADDGAVARFHRVLLEFVVDLGRHLPFPAARPGGAHGAHVGLGRYFAGMAQQLLLGFRLDQPQFVQGDVERDEFGRGGGAAARDFADFADAGGDAGIPGRMFAEGVVDLVAADQQLRQQAFQFGGGEGLVGAVFGYRALGAGAAAVPDLAFLVALAHEQEKGAFFTARRQHHHRVRLVEAGQVPEIGILAEFVVHVAVADQFARGRNDSDSVRADRLHQAVAAGGVFLQFSGAWDGHLGTFSM